MSAELKRFHTLDEALVDVDHAGELVLRIGDADAIPAEVGKLHRLRSLYVIGERKLPYRIPPEVVALHQLRTFRPGGTYDTFPSELLEMRQLEELELGYPSTFQTFPDAFAQLDRLAVLKLSGHDFDVFPEVLTRMPSLRVLDLERCGIAALPDGFRNLVNLEQLAIGGRWDAPTWGFPPALLALTKLRELSIDYAISELPADIARLANLETLSICKGERLSRLPPEIGKLKKLKKLAIREQAFEALPAEIGELGALETLDLYNNKLTALPAEIGKLASLTKLDLRGNPLPELPPQIGGLAALRELQLGDQHGELRALPREIGKLTNLDILSVQSVPLAEIPSEIGGLESLRCCYFRRTNVAAIPDTIGLLQKLEILALDQNKLTRVPDTLAACSKLSQLELTGNVFPPAEVAKLGTIIGVFKARSGFFRFEAPRTQAADIAVPIAADARPLTPDVVAQLERLGGTVGAPGEDRLEKLVLGDWPVPVAIRQLHYGLTWPAGTLFRGTLMKGWGAKVLQPPHYVVDLKDYECSHHAPYYPLTCEEDGQVYYVINLADPVVCDPVVYRLDCHDYREHHPLRTGLTLAQLLAKLKPIAGAEQRALMGRVYRAEGAERAEVAAQVAKLPKKKLVDLEARSRLHWLLENGGDPEHDVAVRVAALAGLAKLGSDAAESATLVASMVEHADARVRAAAGKAAAKLKSP